MLGHKTIVKSKTTFLIFLSVGLFSAAIGVLFRPAHAQWVGGHITTDTTWTVTGSPYRVINDVIVDPGVLLTIEAGVEVQVADGVSLIVEGSLDAIGTDVNPIAFTSSRVSPSPGAWNTIKFQGSSNEQFLLENVRIEFAVHGVTIESLGRATIKKSELTACSESGTYVTGEGNVLLVKNTIKHNKNGISTDNAWVHSGIVLINNTLEANHENGIYFFNNDWRAFGYIYNIMISGNTILSNGENGIDIYGYGAGSEHYPAGGEVYNVTVSGNTILFNKKHGIYLHCRGERTHLYNVTVSENKVSFNRNGIVIECTHHQPNVSVDVYIFDNVFSSNKRYPDGGGNGILICGGVITNVSRNSICYNEYYGVCYYYFQGYASVNNFAAFNDIYENTYYGMYVHDGTSTTAEYDYWGHSTGPNHASLNPEGIGALVNGNGTDLDFIPFLTSPVGMINQRPVAVLEVDKNDPNVNETVTFDASESTDDGRIDYYFFDFGDGTNSSWTPLSVVTHKYASEDTYNATLMAMDDFGVASLDGDLVYAEISVVPEFPASEILPFFMILTLIVVSIVLILILVRIGKRRLRRKGGVS